MCRSAQTPETDKDDIDDRDDEDLADNNHNNYQELVFFGRSLRITMQRHSWQSATALCDTTLRICAEGAVAARGLAAGEIPQTNQ